jgi:iron-sulfur cluster assembly protein
MKIKTTIYKSMENIITITNNAAIKANELMKESNLDDSYFVRVSVKGGGCSGLMYQLDFDNSVIEGDIISDSNGVKVVCDKRSVLYLMGTELDYSGGLNGKGFVFSNPQASRSCGCGESFSV